MTEVALTISYHGLLYDLQRPTFSALRSITWLLVVSAWKIFFVNLDSVCDFMCVCITWNIPLSPAPGLLTVRCAVLSILIKYTTRWSKKCTKECTKEHFPLK